MKCITIEEHITSNEILEECRKNQFNEGEISLERMKFFEEKALVKGKLNDIEKERLPYMNKTGITMQVLSYVNPIDSDMSNDKKTELCKKENNFLKEKIDQHPDRFSAFASIPLWDVDESVKELERCVNELGFVGALVMGKFNGHFLDEKQFIKFFEKAAELDVPVYFHPSMPVTKIQDYYYTSCDNSWTKEVANEFGSAGFGWHLDIGIQVVRMILSGIFDKFPNLKLITGHWGEGIPMMLDRMDYMMTKELTGLKKNISEYYRENIYVTPSGIISDINLKAITEYMGADHIIWAVDYPYIKPDNVTDFLMNSSLSDEEKQLISYKNAEKLFKM